MSRMSREKPRQAERRTGPRTAHGKARVARNARRHGLSLPVATDAALAPEISALALEIAGDAASDARRAAATRIAEAQIDLVRIRRVRLAVTEQLLAGKEVTGELVRLDRYERRARSRRKLAIHEFDEAGWDALKLKDVS
jgi:hypothetical protein